MAKRGDIDSDMNGLAIEAVSNKLAEVTNLAEQLDRALCGSESLSTTTTGSTNISKLALDENADWYASVLEKSNETVSKAGASSSGGSSSGVAQSAGGHEDGSKSEEEFITASECTCTPPSRSSSFHTASEGEVTSPWWEGEGDGEGEQEAGDEIKHQTADESPEEVVTSVVENVVVTETHYLTLSHKTEDVPLPASMTERNIHREVAAITAEKPDEISAEGEINLSCDDDALLQDDSGLGGAESCAKNELEIKKEGEADINDNIVHDLKETKDWLELKVLELTPALTLLGIDLEEALQLQQAHNEVLLRIQSKQSPVEEMLRKADELIASQKGGRAEVYAAMADSLAVAWQDVNTQLHRRKTILDFNVRYHRNATLCLERTRALEMSVCCGAPLPVEVSAIEELLARLHQARRAMLESLMLALQDGRCLLDELQAIAQEGTLDSRPDHIRTAANCAVSQVEHWLENLHDRRRLLEVSYNERKIQLEQCLTLALLTIDLRQLEGVLEKRQESLARSRDELGDSEASSQLLLHEHRKLMPEAKDLQEKGLKILKASEELQESGHFAGEEAVAQAYKLLNNASEYIEETETRDDLLMKANSFFRSAQTTTQP